MIQYLPMATHKHKLYCHEQSLDALSTVQSVINKKHYLAIIPHTGLDCNTQMSSTFSQHSLDYLGGLITGNSADFNQKTQ